MKKLLSIIAVLGSFAFANAQEVPSFPGGEEALNKYISSTAQYPQIAKDNGVEGIVVVGFMVDIDGSLNDLKIVKFVDPDLEKEALRVVEGMPAWIPAQKDGTPIIAPSKVEIPFLLE